MGNARNLSELLDSNGDVKSEYLDNTSAYTKSDTDPTITANATLGDLWVNYNTNKVWVCTDETVNNNVWTNSKDSNELIQPNQPPTNPTNTGSFPATANRDESFSFTFSGATDSVAGTGTPNVTHYLVDSINTSNLTVTTAEVAVGSAHTFNVGAIAADENVSFRVRAKDNNGAYSSGITINLTLFALLYTQATGGTITTIGDYKYHTFNSSSTFTVTQKANSAAEALYGGLDILLVAGGGGGGQVNSGGQGGGGAGGHLVVTDYTAYSAQGYSISIGGGGGANTSGSNTTGFSQTAIAGGRGAREGTSGGAGGSGGGCFYGYGGCTPGAGTAGQGYRGGYGQDTSCWPGGGGGGASQVGFSNSGSTPGAGGAGLAWLDGTTRAGGGGGGSACSGGAGGAGGGGNGGGGYGSTAGSGTTNTGGGGGGGDYGGAAGSGGSGVVIVRYRFQQE